MKARTRIVVGAVLLAALAVLWTSPVLADTYETVSGSISATTGGDNAYGLLPNNGDLTVTTMSGSISVTAGRDNAYGLYSGNGITVNYLTGTVSATAGRDNAYGLDSGSAMAVTTLSGSVSANADGDDAYGLHSGTNMTVNYLTGTVSATAGANNAYGLYGGTNMTVNYLTDTVTATAGGDYAFGLLANDGDLTVTTLSGSVSTTAGGDLAYGLRAKDGDLTVDTLSGSVSAATGGNTAGGLCSDYLTVDTLSGSVSATAGNGASGLYSYRNMTVDTLSGSISTTAGGTTASGLFSQRSMTLDTLSGSISATAGGNQAYGLLSFTNMTLDTLSGSVSATAGGYGALGVSSRTTLFNSTGGAVDISGSVIAEANGLAVAVSAGEGMELYVTGTLSATDTSGAGNAYAIAAGLDDFSGGWTLGGAYDDTVTLGSGASITGDIDLGGGTNLLTLEGAGTMNGDVTNVTTMTKNNAGTWSTGSIATGDLTVNAGTLKVNVTQSANPTVAATGTVTNNADIKFSLGGRIVAGTFTALSSAALAGAGTYTTDSVFLTAAINGTDVELTKRTFAEVLGGSQLASAIDAAYATAGDELYALISAIEQSSSQAEAQEAMDQLTSLLLSQGMDLSIGAARLGSLATQSRMAEMRSYQTLLAANDSEYAMDPDDPSSWPMVAAVGDLSGMLNRSPDNDPNGIYLRAIGRTGEMDSHGGYSGYDYDSVLFAGGYDRMVGERLLLGLSAAYGFTDADYEDEGGSTSRLDSYTLGLYASLFHEAWYLDLILSATYNDYDLKRELPALRATAEADPTGHTLTAKTEGGYRLESGDWGLTPRASLEYTSFHQDGYTESGAGAANLVMDDMDSDFLESGLGATIDHTWQTGWGLFIPELSAMWLHEWLEQDREITYSLTGLPGTVFSDTMAETSNDSLRLGAGVRFVMDSGVTLTTRYQGEIEEYGHSHSLLLEAQWVF